MTEADVEKIVGICSAQTLALSALVRHLCEKGMLDRAELIKELQDFREDSRFFLPEPAPRAGEESPEVYGFVHTLKSLQLALSQKGRLESSPVSVEIRRSVRGVHHA
jgi:hypothetical protein